MDYNDIVLSGSTDVTSYCDTLDAGVEYYKNLVSELKNTKTEILNNWDGNTNDIIDVTTKIDNVVVEFEKLIPGVSQLSSAVRNLSETSQQIANNDVSNGGATTTGNDTSGDVYGPPAPTEDPTTGTTGETATEEPKKNDSIFSGSFWKEIGKDFTNDWDYSDTADHGSLWTVIGDTGQGLLNTAGSVVNTIGRFAGGIWGAIFG